jgi:hypothetical protein
VCPLTFLYLKLGEKEFGAGRMKYLKSHHFYHYQNKKSRWCCICICICIWTGMLAVLTELFWMYSSVCAGKCWVLPWLLHSKFFRTRSSVIKIWIQQNHGLMFMWQLALGVMRMSDSLERPDSIVGLGGFFIVFISYRKWLSCPMFCMVFIPSSKFPDGTWK